MLKIALIIGSTRATRFADKPAAWLNTIVSERIDADYEVRGPARLPDAVLR